MSPVRVLVQAVANQDRRRSALFQSSELEKSTQCTNPSAGLAEKGQNAVSQVSPKGPAEFIDWAQKIPENLSGSVSRSSEQLQREGPDALRETISQGQDALQSALRQVIPFSSTIPQDTK